MITNNLPFKQSDTVFPNAACAVALIDRLTHHAEIIAIDGESSRGGRPSRLRAEAGADAVNDDGNLSGRHSSADWHDRSGARPEVDDDGQVSVIDGARAAFGDARIRPAADSRPGQRDHNNEKHRRANQRVTNPRPVGEVRGDPRPVGEDPRRSASRWKDPR